MTWTLCFLIAAYAVITACWWHYMYSHKSPRNWHWMLCWTVFIPVTVISVAIVLACWAIESAMDWLTKEHS